MGIAHAENGIPIIVSGENGLPGPDKNGNYPIVVFSDWYEKPDRPTTVTELGEVTPERVDGRDEVVAVQGLHAAYETLH